MKKCRKRQMKKNCIALVIGAFLCLNLMGSTVVAFAVVKPIVKVASVKLSKTKEALMVNKTDTLKTTITPGNATNKVVTWKSSNIKIANVDKLGKVTAVSGGIATITATTVDGSKRATCVVTVTKPVISKPVYNGSAIKEKVRTIEGVFDLYGGLSLNKYGKEGASQFTCFNFSVVSGKRDMNFTIKGSNPEVDKKIKIILNWILPTKGNALYTILDNPNVKSQIIKLDGRTVDILVEQSFVSIDFGPTIK